MSSKNIGKIVKIKIGTKKVYIVLENKERIEVSYQVFKSLNLKEGQMFKQSDKTHINELKLGEKLFSYALKLASTSCLSKNELKKRLIKKHANVKQIEDIISNLLQEGLLNEEEYIDEYLEHYHNRFYGINRIKKLLREKGYDLEVIKNIAYDEQLEQELANALIKILEKKYHNSNYSSLKEKCYKKLIYNGFEFEVANNALNLLDDKSHVSELNCLKIDLEKAKRKYINKCSSKDLYNNVIKYLLSKGYRFNDIEMIKGEILNEMD